MSIYTQTNSLNNTNTNYYTEIKSIIKSLEHTSQINTAFTQQKTDQLIKQLYENLVLFSLRSNASDIHIEPKKINSCIRIRIDSVLQSLFDFPKQAHNQIVSKIKVLSNLDISQTRLPQDGKINFENDGIINFQLRTSICPTTHGEKVVLRLLRNQKNFLNINKLQMDKNTKNAFMNSIEAPQGLVLITGPTGSGKTVTLYSALNHLNTQEKNIVTIEDPVEIQLPGVNQTAVNIKSGLSFDCALSAFLRQDPDIIMIGEIRDKKTAEIALQAAHTGHLVFATLHTNSCLDVVTRLEQLGVDYYTLITSLKLILSQRLLRKINHQKSESFPQEYRGRIAIFEHLYFDKRLQNIALKNKNYIPSGQMPKYTNLRAQANYYIKNNITDLKEVNRVLGPSLYTEIDKTLADNNET